MKCEWKLQVPVCPYWQSLLISALDPPKVLNIQIPKLNSRPIGIECLQVEPRQQYVLKPLGVYSIGTRLSPTAWAPGSISCLFIALIKIVLILLMGTNSANYYWHGVIYLFSSICSYALRWGISWEHDWPPSSTPTTPTEALGSPIECKRGPWTICPSATTFLLGMYVSHCVKLLFFW